jgi:hypothetical protein
VNETVELTDRQMAERDAELLGIGFLLLTENGECYLPARSMIVIRRNISKAKSP